MKTFLKVLVITIFIAIDGVLGYFLFQKITDTQYTPSSVQSSGLSQDNNPIAEKDASNSNSKKTESNTSTAEPKASSQTKGQVESVIPKNKNGQLIGKWEGKKSDKNVVDTIEFSKDGNFTYISYLLDYFPTEYIKFIGTYEVRDSRIALKYEQCYMDTAGIKGWKPWSNTRVMDFTLLGNNKIKFNSEGFNNDEFTKVDQ